MPPDGIGQWLQQRGGFANPIGQGGGAVEFEVLATVGVTFLIEVIMN